MSTLTEYERGKEEGRVNALLGEHTARLNKINGNIERFAKSNETLAKTMREDATKTREALDLLSSALRTMQEEGRARDLAVTVAAETLAKETERRRIEEDRLRIERATALEAPARTWDIRASKASVIYLFIALASIIATIYFATR